MVGVSLAELCMGRKLRAFIPQSIKHLIPEWPFLEMFLRINNFKREKQCYFNR